MPEDIIKLNGSELIEMINNLNAMHNQLIDQNTKLQEIYQQNQRKILCYEASLEIIDQLINKGLAYKSEPEKISSIDENGEVTKTTNVNDDKKE